MFPPSRLPSLRLLDGPPPSLPQIVDAASERWWGLRPRTRAGLGAVIALVVLAAGAGHVASSPWGPPVTVLVAARDLETGETLTRSDVRRTGWPESLVPAGALSEATGTVVTPIPEGAVLTDRYLGDAGLAAALPDGHVAVPLPMELLPRLPAGVRLDLVAAQLDGRGVTVAQRALLLSGDGTQVWVAVERAVAADVAAAATTGQLTAVILPP